MLFPIMLINLVPSILSWSKISSRPCGSPGILVQTISELGSSFSGSSRCTGFGIGFSSGSVESVVSVAPDAIFTIIKAKPEIKQISIIGKIGCTSLTCVSSGLEGSQLKENSYILHYK